MTRALVVIMAACGWMIADRAVANVINVPADHATIQEAIVAAMNGDEVVVAPGTYVENIDFIGKTITVRSTDPTDQVVVDATVISGDGTVVTIENGEGRQATISGFTITGGVSSGMRIISSSPTVSWCVFAGNSNKNNRGGGLYIGGSGTAPVIRRCEFSGNTAGGHGGGLALESTLDDTAITYCTFIGNTADWGGGAYLAPQSGSTTIANCFFGGNTAFDPTLAIGGGLFLSNDARVVNCVFSSNEATVGGGLVVSGSEPAVTNCTFAGNNATSESSAAGGLVGGGAVVENCVVWGNTPIEASGNDIMYSCIQGGFPGEGNVDADPMFFSPAGLDGVPGTVDDDLRLTLGSSCIDVGSDDAVPVDTADLDGDGDIIEIVSVDHDGDPRFLDGDGGVDLTVDMGAYEFQADCNSNGILDDIDIANGTSEDCNLNGFPDECELDTNGDGVIDACDCNGNGLFDADDIAIGASGDFNQNDTPDECESPATIGEAHWADPSGGFFGDFRNWMPETPWPVDPAVFDLDAAYTVEFTRDQQNDRLTVSTGNVIFEMAGNVYELTSPSASSILVGSSAFVPTLTVRDTPATGQLRGPTCRIGSDPGEEGVVTVADGGTLFLLDSICIGCEGTGTLAINEGGSVLSATAAVGDQTGSRGDVFVDGSWSTLFFMNVNNDARVFVNSTGTLDAGFFALVSADGKIDGNGEIFGEVINFGVVAPLADNDGLRINGGYEQIGEQPGFGPSSGTLEIALPGPGDGTFAGLDVTGQATLGGGLIVSAPGGFDPALGESFTILDAPSIVGAFDVALLPGLPNSKFLSVGYGGAGPGPAESVTIGVGDLLELFGFGDPEVFGLDGAPSDALLGDFDGDGLLDLAVTLPDVASPDGAVAILLNDGDGFGGGTTQITVGEQPTALTAGLFDGDSDLDLAVANAGDGVQDGEVLVLFNDGGGGFAVSAPITVGALPSEITTGDIDGDLDADLIVTNAGDDTILVLPNDGGGGFIASQTRPTGVFPIMIDVRDLDDDRDLDLIVLSAGSASVTVLLNLGGGVYDGGSEIAVGAGPGDMVLDDFDGNTGVDIVTTNFIDGTVSVLLNDDGTFLPAVNLPVGANPGSVVSIDLEPDGDLDLAFIADDPETGTPVIQVLRNDQSGPQLVFATAELLDAGTDPLIVLAGDVVGNPTEDLVVVNGSVGDAAADGPGPATGEASILWNCPADLDGSGDVGFGDILAIINAWGPCDMACPSDLNGNGTVDFGDILAVIGEFGDCS
ncbi:MAG: hypothetical protein GY715_16595 [Planctomycetes bacterium]|nr:hypothetical protein [Planctomycetota bacterium]